jgi:hypothetical protein
MTEPFGHNDVMEFMYYITASSGFRVLIEVAAEAAAIEKAR